MPKIDRDTAPRYERQAYPGRLRARTSGCWKTRLSDAGELTQFGFGEVELAPGAATSLAHWHEAEDELVYILEGRVVLIEGAEETDLGPGDCVTFKAGVAVAHTFENRSDAPARLLEVGPRGFASETVHYPALDMIYRREGQAVRFETRDGRPLAPDDEPRRLDDPQTPTLASSIDID